jgi:hypothetical protein
MSNFDLRLSALSKLMAVKSAAVDERLSQEYARVEQALRNSNDYDELAQSLKTLGVLVSRYHMAATDLLDDFVSLMISGTRALTVDGAPIPASRTRYRSANHLLRDAIDVAAMIAYVHTDWFVGFLLALCGHADNEVAKRVQQALNKVATFDLDIFYGDPPRGAEPQTRLVAYFSQLDDDALKHSSRLLIGMLDQVLSPSIQGTSMTSHHTMTFRRGQIANEGGVAEMRSAAIELCKRLYALDPSVDHRKRVLQTLDTASRRENAGSSKQTSTMFERDAITVLEFLRVLVDKESLPIVQSIEHQAYWDYYHAASPEVKRKALETRDAIDAHAEYQIYKQLIGFDGVFGKWEDLSRPNDAWEFRDDKRRAAMRDFLASIDAQNYIEWRDRILRFSETRSDDMAMFPIFYDFLSGLGQQQPDMALELLTEHEEVMGPFLIALMRGLWDSPSHAEVETVALNWIKEGKHLANIAKSLYTVGTERLNVLRQVIDRGAELEDRAAIVQSMGVAAGLFAAGENAAKDEFLHALRIMAGLEDAGWASVIWFSKDFRNLVNAMTPAERAEVLKSLTALTELDYQAEDVLYEIGKHDMQAVVEFVIARLAHDRMLEKQRRQQKLEGRDVEEEKFEAIPYQLTKLNKLFERAPDALLKALRSDFDDEVRAMFVYRGVRLVRATFPNYEPELEKLLLKYVATGREDDMDFAIGILRSYEGSPAILPVCKAIVRAVPERSRLWNEVGAAIETTGVVTGEFGMAEAYERKLQSLEPWKTDEDERVRSFAEWLSDGLVNFIAQERQRAEQGLALYKYRFGSGEGG